MDSGERAATASLSEFVATVKGEEQKTHEILS
jgi:hypothetical protein